MVKYYCDTGRSDLEMLVPVPLNEATKYIYYLWVRVADLYFSALHMASLSFQKENPEVFPDVWFMLACEVDHSS